MTHLFKRFWKTGWFFSCLVTTGLCFDAALPRRQELNQPPPLDDQTVSHLAYLPSDGTASSTSAKWCVSIPR